MPVDVNLGIDMPYNNRLRERNRLLSQMDIITHNPQLLGGGRLRDVALSGNNGAYPMDRDRLMELKAMGGAFNLTKFLRPTMKVLKSKQAQAIIRPLTDEVVRQGVKYAVGGKINRLKKAKKWTGYAVDTVSKGLDLGSKAKKLFGYGELEDVAVKVVRRSKKVLADPLVQEVIARARKAPIVKQAVKRVKAVVGGGRAARAAIVKKVMKDHGLGMIAASSFVKKNGLY